MSPANAISVEVDNEPLINEKHSNENANENKDPQSEKSEKDVVVIYGSIPPPSSTHSSLDNNPSTFSSSKNPIRQSVPSIQTFTVGQDGTFPSKLLGLASFLLLIIPLSKGQIALLLISVIYSHLRFKQYLNYEVPTSLNLLSS